MTDTKSKPYYSDEAYDAIASLDVNLGDEASIREADSAKQRRLLKQRDAELATVRRQRDDYATKIDRLRADAERAALADRRLPGETVEDADSAFLLFRRTMTSRYLKAREAFEDDPTEVNVARHEVTRDALALVYTSEGGHGNSEQVLTHFERLGFLIAEQWVELWAHREGVLAALGSREIVGIADRVREGIASGFALGELPMHDYAAVHLDGGGE